MRQFLAFLAAIFLLGNTPAEVDSLLEAGDDAAAYSAAQHGAAAGDATLTGYVGWFFDNGRYVAEDKERAAEFFRMAADMGDAYSQWRLAVLIDEGAVEGSLEEAVSLLRKAAAQKHSDGMIGLAVMHASGRGVEQDHVAAMRYYQAAARMGNGHGLQGMGVLYANGEGVKRDLGEALAFWLVASAAGNETADELLAEFMPQLDDTLAGQLLSRADAIAQAYGFDASFDTADTAGA